MESTAMHAAFIRTLSSSMLLVFLSCGRRFKDDLLKPVVGNSLITIKISVCEAKKEQNILC
jgi:hypothetical protein